MVYFIERAVLNTLRNNLIQLPHQVSGKLQGDVEDIKNMFDAGEN